MGIASTIDPDPHGRQGKKVKTCKRHANSHYREAATFLPAGMLGKGPAASLPGRGR